MASIVDSGTDRNLTNTATAGTLVPDPTERRFVTFVNELGGVHTIVVEVEHAAKDAEELVKWFEHTRGLVMTSASNPTDPKHVPPDQVIERANEHLGFNTPDAGAEGTPGQPTNRQEG